MEHLLARRPLLRAAAGRDRPLRERRGEFFGDDTFAGKPILVRYIWSEITGTSARWEQAFSTDRGTTWETNWIMSFQYE